MWIKLFQFEEAAKEVADEVTKPRPAGEEEIHDVQVILHSNSNACPMRDLKVNINFTHTILLFKFLSLKTILHILK